MGFDGLDWQRIDLPWGGGIDAKSHPYLGELPKASQLINYRFQKSGALSARPGLRRFGAAPSNFDLESMAVYNRSLIALGRTGARRLDDLVTDDSDYDGEWRSLKTPGPRSVSVRRRPIVRNEDGCRVAFSAAQNGRLVHVWSKTTSAAPEVWFLVEDIDTGAVIRGPEVLVGIQGFGGSSDPASTADQDGVQVVAHENDFVTVFACSSTTPSVAGSVSIYIPSAASESVAEVGLGTAVTHTGVDAQSLIASAIQNNSNVYGVASTTRLHRFVRTGATFTPALQLQSTCVITGLGTPLGVAIGSIYVTALGYDGTDLVYAQQFVGATLDAADSAVSCYTLDATDPTPRRAVGIGGDDGAFFVDCGSMIALADDYGSTLNNTACLRLVRVDDGGDCTSVLDWRIWHVGTYGHPWDSEHEWSAASGRVVCPVVSPRTQRLNEGQAEADPRELALLFRRAGTLLEWDVQTSNGNQQEPPVVRRIGVFGIDLARPMETDRRSHSYLRSTAAGETRRFFGGLSETVTSGVRGFLVDGATSSFQADAFEVDDGPKAVWRGEVNGLHLAGSGILSCVDEVRHAESMQMPPPVLRVVDEDRLENVNFSGYYPVGEWALRACWMWRDAQGLVHRSAPSEPIRFVTTQVGEPPEATMTNVAGIRVAVPPFAEWRQDEAAQTFPTDLFIEFYTSPGAVEPTPSAPAIAVDNAYFRQRVFDSIAFSGGGLDRIPSVLSGERELTRLVPAIDPALPGWTEPIYIMGGIYAINSTLPLYTNGRVLGNDPTPCPVHVATTRERVWLIDSEDRYTVWASKPIVAGKCPEFSAAVVLRTPTEAGELTALGAIDDLVIFFGSDSIHVLDTSAGGPDSTGVGAWAPLRRVSREVGCINARSVVTADVGCFFASRAGIYLFQANGSLEWVGRDLGDNLDLSTIVGASVVPGRKEVVFATPNALYVFDYDHGQWSTFGFADASVLSGSTIEGVTHAPSGLVIARDDGAAFIDDAADAGLTGERVTYSVTTGWIHLGGLTGFQKVRRVHLLGRFGNLVDPGPPPFETTFDLGTLTMQVAYNYNAADVESYILGGALLFDAYLAGKLDPCRLSWMLRRKRCQALRFTFTYVGGASGQLSTGVRLRPELAGLGLEVGAKRRSRTEKHFFGLSATLPSDGG